MGGGALGTNGATWTSGAPTCDTPITSAILRAGWSCDRLVPPRLIVRSRRPSVSRRVQAGKGKMNKIFDMLGSGASNAVERYKTHPSHGRPRTPTDASGSENSLSKAFALEQPRTPPFFAPDLPWTFRLPSEHLPLPSGSEADRKPAEAYGR